LNDVSKPTLADHVAVVDAVEVASRIVVRGARGAIGASTAEIVAMAHHVMRLATLADLTFELLEIADRAVAEKRPEEKRALGHAVKWKCSDVGFALEKLGYGRLESQQEKTDATES
jgi:hypothetical protein